MIRISLPLFRRKTPAPSWPCVPYGPRVPRAPACGAVEECEAAELLGAVPRCRQVLLDQLLGVPPAAEEPAHRRREGGLVLAAGRRGDEQAGDVVPVAEPPHEPRVEEPCQPRVAAHRRLRPAI